MPEFRWTDEAHEAAELLAAGKLGIGKIAAKLLVTPKTIWNWRQVAEFAERVRELAEIRRSEIRRVGIAEVENRLAALQADFDALGRVQRARARDARKRKKLKPDGVVPGEETGLVVRGALDRPILDGKLLKARQLILIHAARELGQWGVKPETSAVDIDAAVKRTRDRAAAYSEDRDDEATE